MSDLDHFRHFKRFLNPSLNDRFDYDPADEFEPELSIQESCWHSEGNGQSDFGFFLDGHYHSIIVLTRWPRTTLLHHYSGLTVRQIASKLKLPATNIQARLCRAYEKLRRLMWCDSQWRLVRKEFRDQFPPMEEP